MISSRFFTTTGDLYRLTTTTVSGDTTEAYTSFSSSVPSNIQPVSEELIALGGGNFFNTFTIYFDDSVDVRKLDKYVVDSVDYIIQGVQTRTYGSGRTNHKQCSAIRK